jgi:hypothetical protein
LALYALLYALHVLFYALLHAYDDASWLATATAMQSR